MRVFVASRMPAMVVVLFVLLSVFCVSINAQDADCSYSKADIVFLLDASSSEGSDNFAKQLDFVGNFTNRYDIGPDRVQISIVTFASQPNNSFYLNTYSNKTTLLDGIQNVKYTLGNTYTNLALKYVGENSFLAANGGRTNVPKILVVMTDGESTEPQQTAKEAIKLHTNYADIKIIAIGIGDQVHTDELRTIASDTDHAFTVPSFNTLQTIEQEIQNITVQCIPAKLECSDNKADIIFLLDSSISEGETNFRKQLDFVTNFTNAYDIGPDHVQVGIITFSSTPHLGFNLNKYSDKPSLIQGIQNINYLPGNTYTNLALKYVRDNGFIPIHGSRTGVPKILVVMTDGESTDPYKTKTEASILHYTDVKVISIGIGDHVDTQELTTIASDAQHMFKVPSFDSLQSIQGEIQTATCVSEKIESCDSKQADIVFILDGSSSEGDANFQKQLDLVRNVTEKFQIGPNNIQVSVVTFSTNAYNEFFLNTYSKKADLLSAINNVTYYGGVTHTYDALKNVRLNSFKPENGGRGPPVSKLAIVITDGNSADRQQTKTEADRLKHTGVKVMSVGIGSSISQTELDNIATDKQHAFAVANFDLLNTLQTELESVACKTTSECGDKPADIVFVLDGSSSEGSDNFHKQIDFMTNFVKSFDVGPSSVQFALLEFNSAVTNEFYLNTYSDKASMIADIQSARYPGGSTGTDNALRYARYYHFTEHRGARANATKILILLTDGQSSDPPSTLHEADQLKKMGVTIITVGIGDNVDNSELRGVATDQNHVFTVGNFDLLHSFQEEIKAESCGEKTPAPTPAPECGNKPADIVFVLDSSSSEGNTNFQKQLDFVRDFTYQFSIGPQAIQVSVIVFSTYTHEQFPLNRYQNQATLLSAVSKIPFIGGATYTNEALAYVRKHSFIASKGARQNASHIVIVLTDGASTRPQDTKLEAAMLKNQTNMVVIAVGIGSSVSQTEIETIATDHNHALNVQSFDALAAIKSELTYVACKSKSLFFVYLGKGSWGSLGVGIRLIVESLFPMTPEAYLFKSGVHHQGNKMLRVTNVSLTMQVVLETCAFIAKADIVFILDASSSEGSDNFLKQLDFVARVANDFSIGTKDVQIGLITYSDNPNLEFYLNAYTSKSSLLSAIQKVPYAAGSTRTDLAIQYAKDNMFTAAHGDRADSKNYVIILTDGASTNSNQTIHQATLLKQQNIDILAIGIGSNVNKNELDSMASDVNHVFTVASFDALKTIRDDIKKAACEDVVRYRR